MASQVGLPISSTTIHAFGQKTSKYVFGKTNSLGNQTIDITKNAQQSGATSAGSPGMALRDKYQELFEKLEGDYRKELREHYSEEMKSQIRSEIENYYPAVIRAELKAKLEPGLTRELRHELKEEMREKLETHLKQEIKADLRTMLEPALLTELNADRQEAKAACDKMEQRKTEEVTDSCTAGAVTKSSKSTPDVSREFSEFAGKTAFHQGATRTPDHSEPKKLHKRTRDESNCEEDKDMPHAKRPDQRHREHSVDENDGAFGADVGVWGDLYATHNQNTLQEESSKEADDDHSPDCDPNLELDGADANIGIRTIHEGVVEESTERDEDDYDACLDVINAIHGSELLDSPTENASSSMENADSSIETAGSSVGTADSSPDNAHGFPAQDEIDASIKNAIELEEYESDEETIDVPRTTPPREYSIFNDNLMFRLFGDNGVQTYNDQDGFPAQDCADGLAPSVRQESYDDFTDYESDSEVMQDGFVESQGCSVRERVRSQHEQPVERWEDEDEYEEEDTLVDGVGATTVVNSSQKEGESEYDYVLRLAREAEKKAHEYDCEAEEEEEEL